MFISALATRLRRIPVRFHWSLALFPLLLLGLDAIGARDARGPGHEMIYAAFIFASILLHELGHAVAAHSVGIRTREVTLHLVGGHARLERHPGSGREELLIALAGPAVNVAIAVVLLGLRFTGAIPASSLANELAILNLALALFNMLPLFPLDGGRALRAVLSFVMSHAGATTVAASCGVVAGALMILLSMEYGAPVVGLVAFFLAFGSYVEGKAVMQALAMAEAREKRSPVGAPRRA
ncbi:MAG: site-2 protease family protein [Pseudomonadota bacterium]